MSARFIVCFFAISIISGLVLAMYIRLTEENIGKKYIWFGMKKFFYYQFCVPLFAFPFIIYSQKDIVAKFIVEDLLDVSKEAQKKTIKTLAANIDLRFVLMFWRLYLYAINIEYEAFTDGNLNLVKQLVKDKRKQEEGKRRKQGILRQQIDLMDNDKSRQLLDRCNMEYC